MDCYSRNNYFIRNKLVNYCLCNLQQSNLNNILGQMKLYTGNYEHDKKQWYNMVNGETIF